MQLPVISLMNTGFWKVPSLFALMFLVVLPSQAADIVWTNAGSGNWNVAASWMPNQVPGVSDNAFITNNGIYAVTISANTSVSSIKVGGSSGTQSLVLNSGILTIAGASSIGTQGGLTINGGTMQGNGDVTVTGTWNWTGGIMGGAGRTIVSAGATASFSGANAKGINRTIENTGTITYGGTGLSFGFTAATAGMINNLAGGVFNVTADGDFTQSSAAAHAFNNQGTFNKSGAGTDTDFNSVPFNNTGTVNFTSGTLSFNNGGSNSTGIVVPAGTTLNLGGTFTHGVGSTLSGAGTFNFNNGTHNFVGQFLPTGPVNFIGGTITIANTMAATSALISGATVNFNAAQSLPSLTQSGGTMQGNGDVTVTGTWNWTGGIMGGAGRTIVSAGATASFSGANAKGINRTIENTGTITYGGTGLSFGFTAATAGIINNLAGGVFTVTGEADLTQSSFAAHAFNNSGRFNKSGAGTTTLFSSVPFNNTGVVSISSGTMRLNSGNMSFPGSAVLLTDPGATLQLSVGNLAGATTNSDQWMSVGRVLFDNSGTHQLEIMGRDLGNVPAGYTNNFSYGTLEVAGGVTVTLIDNADNVPGPEALYVDTLIVAAGTTLNLAGLHVYARNTQISGTILNGTISVAIGEQFGDLVVETLGAPDTASVGGGIQVNWTVRNSTNASDATPVSVWQDRVVLSTDAIVGNGDELTLATVQHNGALATNASYSASTTVTLPGNRSGNLYLFVITDSGNTVYEFAYETNNISVGRPIAVAAPDLVVSNVTAVATGTAGSVVPVSWAVTNLGPGAANADWSDRIYISANAVLDGADTLLVSESAAALTPLPPGAGYTKSRTVTLPANFIGANYLLVVADGTSNQLESNEGNNVAAVAININAADLSVTNLEITPVTLFSGTDVLIRWNDTNSGSGPARGYWSDQVVVSNLTTGVKIAESTLYYDSTAAGGAISNGQSRARQYSFRLPDGPNGAGNLQFRVRTDVYNTVPEYNPSGTGENNNLAVLLGTSTLSAYPDLQVTNLVVTPAILQSGASLLVTWESTNSGAASVERVFYDRIVVRNKTTAETLVNTTLIYNPAMATNGPIAGGESRSRQYSFQLPNGLRGAGEFEFTVSNDTFNAIFEYNATSTGEVNNGATLTRSSVVAPYPDLMVSDIVAPATGLPGQQVDVSWTVVNQGAAPAPGPWSEQLFLSDNPAGANGVYIASFFYSAGLNAGASATRSERVSLPAFGAGNKYFVVRTDSGNQVYELNEVNNTSVDDQSVLLPVSLSLTFTTHSFSEAAGSSASQGTLIRNTDTSNPLVVTLSSSDTNSARVPVTVTIPAGRASASFPVAAQDNILVDGNRTLTIVAAADGFSPVSDTLTVTDNDTRALLMQIGSASIAENAGIGAALGYLTRNAETNDALVVALSSDNPGKLTVPPSVTINAGERSAVFEINAVDNDFIDGVARVNIQASASTYNPVSAGINVTDNDTVTLSLIVANSTVTEGSGSPATVGTVTRSLVNVHRDQCLRTNQ